MSIVEGEEIFNKWEDDTTGSTWSRVDNLDEENINEVMDLINKVERKKTTLSSLTQEDEQDAIFAAVLSGMETMILIEKSNNNQISDDLFEVMFVLGACNNGYGKRDMEECRKFWDSLPKERRDLFPTIMRILESEKYKKALRLFWTAIRSKTSNYKLLELIFKQVQSWKPHDYNSNGAFFIKELEGQDWKVTDSMRLLFEENKKEEQPDNNSTKNNENKRESDGETRLREIRERLSKARSARKEEAQEVQQPSKEVVWERTETRANNEGVEFSQSASQALEDRLIACFKDQQEKYKEDMTVALEKAVGRIVKRDQEDEQRLNEVTVLLNKALQKIDTQGKIINLMMSKLDSLQGIVVTLAKIKKDQEEALDILYSEYQYEEAVEEKSKDKKKNDSRRTKQEKKQSQKDTKVQETQEGSARFEKAKTSGDTKVEIVINTDGKVTTENNKDETA